MRPQGESRKPGLPSRASSQRASQATREEAGDCVRLGKSGAPLRARQGFAAVRAGRGLEGLYSSSSHVGDAALETQRPQRQEGILGRERAIMGRARVRGG